MLFKKLENSVSEYGANCIIKYGLKNATFESYVGVWYVWHFNEFEISEENDKFWIFSNSKQIVQTKTNGANDGIFDAYDDGGLLTVSGRAMIMLIGNNVFDNVVASGGSKCEVKITSSEPFYSDIDSTSTINYDGLSNLELSKFIATAYRFQLTSNLLMSPVSAYYIEKSSGIKSGQFIL